MEIEINASALVDSPFTASNQELFEFDPGQVEDFINDITYGPPTSYLVSGYRGVGKTSLIKKVENSIQTNDSDQPGTTESQEVVFVYTSFSGPDDYLVRKLIRELYLKVSLTDSYTNLEEGSNKEIEFTKEFQLLYQRTFKEILESNDEINSAESILSISTDPIKLFKSVAKLMAPVVFLTFWNVIIFLNLNLANFIKWLAPLVLLLWTAINLLSLKYSFERRKHSMVKKSTRTLFDDEIASTLFVDTLKRFQTYNFKVVFVLDEVDKVQSQDVDKLITQLKPFLVGGLASFIVVGGQELYYRFDSDADVDDSILSSLFSKVFHVSLSSAAQLRSIFYRSIIDKEYLKLLSEPDKLKLDTLVYYYIFKSRLIPRRFISLIRQNIFWNHNKAFLSDSKIPSDASKCREIIKSIEEVDDRKVSSSNYSAIRDYVITKMYIKSSVILSTSSASLSPNYLNE
jgi:Cdc6-like AAA superfamily ATPase